MHWTKHPNVLPPKALHLNDMKERRVRITQRHGACALLIAVSALLFWKAIKILLVYSTTHESASHIGLIPAVSLFLIYFERKKIYSAAESSPFLGLTLALAGLSLYWQGSRNPSTENGDQSAVAGAVAIVLIWLGVFLLCYGLHAARAALFPLLFLVFMIPLPDSALDRTIYLLQQGSTEVSYLLFKAVGVPVLRQGFLLTVPGVTIEVAKECSGIRSSIALLITSFLAAHLFLRTSWKMFLLAALALPLAIIKNGIRITTLTLLSIYVDPSFLTGRLHRDGGFVFFLIALALLVPFLFLLQKSETHPALVSIGPSPRNDAEIVSLD